MRTVLPLLGEWTILPLPTYMPTWPFPLKNSRSPGCNLLHETFFLIDLYWLCVTLGRDTPALRQAYRTSPEQSNAPGPEAPPPVRIADLLLRRRDRLAGPDLLQCRPTQLGLALALGLRRGRGPSGGLRGAFGLLRNAGRAVDQDLGGTVRRRLRRRGPEGDRSG